MREKYFLVLACMRSWVAGPLLLGEAFFQAMEVLKRGLDGGVSSSHPKHSSCGARLLDLFDL
jgi:hypothetical protein